MISGGTARYVFYGCLAASVVDLILVDFAVGPLALRTEPASGLVAEPPSPLPIVTPAAESNPAASAPRAAPTDAALAAPSAKHPSPWVVARFDSEQLVARDNDLPALAAALRADPGAEIVLEGHADQRGEPARNRALSVERATWAQSRLVELGVSATRIAVVGIGAERPAAQGEDDAAVASNRRVEVRWLTGSPSREDR